MMIYTENSDVRYGAVRLQCPQPLLDARLGGGANFFGTCNYNFSGSN